jgi:hydroxyethylthiazole kinase-like uncharacterized protein yjeF
MTELLTAAQMRAIEAEAIASGAVTGLELMERAGRGVVEAVFDEWPELKATSHRAVVFCGPGNNGGDGFVVARLFKEWGWEVEVFLYGKPEKLPADARVNYERWRGMGEVQAWNDGRQKARFESEEWGQLVVVDALFGTGLSRKMPARTNRTWQGLMPGPLGHNAHEPDADRFVAIDVPSGMCSDSGRDFGAMPTHLTVTFHRPKIGHFLSEGCAPYGGVYGCNKVKVVDIGLKQPIDRGTVRLAGPGATSLGKYNWLHKYSHGHALILSGPPGHTGAARLAARGALRIGAGLVTIAAEPEAIAEHAAHLTGIMLREVGEGDGLSRVLSDKRINVLCVGPGLGLDRHAADLVQAALAWHLPDDPGRMLIDATDAQVAAFMRQHGHRPACVLDADAVTLLSRDPALFAMLHQGCVLTPHGGEFARLFPDIAEKLDAPATKGPAYSKVDATRAAAARAGCVVLFKGPDTVIADPSGRAAINSAHYDRAAPWLATAGSGDVLAGFITGLLARGFAPFEAAQTAAWLHVECALKFGPGLIAEDLPEALPAVFRDLGL